MARHDINETSIPRLRSVPHRAAFYQATFWTIVHLFCVLATITTLVIFFIHHKTISIHHYKKTIIFFLVMSVITLIISFYKRRTARCPLCLGTPLLNTGALAHKRSFALRPLNHGFTAVLSIACSQRFRCMYCGTGYDLLKKRGISDRNKPGKNLESPQ